MYKLNKGNPILDNVISEYYAKKFAEIVEIR